MLRENGSFEQIIDQEYPTTKYPYDPIQRHHARHPVNRHRMQTLRRTTALALLDDGQGWMDYIAADSQRFLYGRNVLHFETLFDESTVGWLAVVTWSIDVVA